MATKVGVGKSSEKESFEAGAAAAREALAQAGTDNCDFIFLFATVGFNQEELLKGVRSVTGDTRLSGCSGEGIITQDGPEGEVMFALSGTDKEPDIVGVMAFSSDELDFFNCVETDLKGNSLMAGEEIGKKINALMPLKPVLLLTFPDANSINMNEFFTGIKNTSKEPLLCAGGLSGHNLTTSLLTYQYHNDQVLINAVPCILISGNVNIELGVNHGCIPIGLDKAVTKSKGNTVYEIDNKSVWKFFQEYLGEEMKELTSENAPTVSIGIKLPEKLLTDYDKYIIRVPYCLNKDESITFATEIPEGTKVRVVRRDEDKISIGAKNMAEGIKLKLGDKKPLAVLHFDCAGRGRMFFGNRVKEKGIDVIQDVIGRDIPWLGLFCFGEIAPIKGINYFHNQTVVLCVIYN